MRYQIGDRVWFRSTISSKIFKGNVIRALKDGFYLVTDGTGLTPRLKHESVLGRPTKPQAHGTFV